MEIMYVLGWVVVSFVGVSVCHWASVKKKWWSFPNWLWNTMLLTIFLPWSLWALTIIWLSVVLPRPVANKLGLRK